MHSWLCSPNLSGIATGVIANFIAGRFKITYYCTCILFGLPQQRSAVTPMSFFSITHFLLASLSAINPLFCVTYPVPSQVIAVISPRTLQAKQFTSHANLRFLFPAQQSAYRPFHSTETALLKVHNDLVRVVNDCRVSQLVLLDLSATFDTVDHQILLCVLSDHFSISSTAFRWFQSYLSERTQSFVHAGLATDCFSVTCSVPQDLLDLLDSLHTPRTSMSCLKSTASIHSLMLTIYNSMISRSDGLG